MGHKCKTKPFVLMLTGDEEELCLHSMFPSTPEVVTNHIGMEERQVSLNAMRESRMGSHMKLEGGCGHQKLQILIDSGSAHSFLEKATVEHIGCQ